MLRTRTIAAAMAVAGAMASPAVAQSWGFDLGGGPDYYGEPPVVYRRAPVPRYYDGPVVLRRVDPRVLHMEAPEDVLDDLDNAGFTELSPMRRRGQLYLLSAVDPDGNLVALEISIFTGEIERTRVLEAAFQPPPEVRRPRRVERAAAPRPAPRPAPPQTQASPPPAAPAPDSGGSPSTLRDRLQSAPAEPSEEEGDPLVVY